DARRVGLARARRGADRSRPLATRRPPQVTDAATAGAVVDSALQENDVGRELLARDRELLATQRDPEGANSPGLEGCPWARRPARKRLLKDVFAFFRRARVKKRRPVGGPAERQHARRRGQRDRRDQPAVGGEDEGAHLRAAADGLRLRERQELGP